MYFGERITISISLTTCLFVTSCSYNFIYRPTKDSKSYYLQDPINKSDTLSVLVEVPFSSKDMKEIQVSIQTKIPERSKLLGLTVELKSRNNIFHQKTVILSWSLPPTGHNFSTFDTTLVKSSFDKLPDDLKYSHLTS